MKERRARRGLVALLSGLALACQAEPDAAGLDFQALPEIPAGTLVPLETYPARDGSALPVRHYAAESPTTLLLVHGSGYHGGYLAPLASRIATSRAARVYTPDLRGHGASPERRGDVDYIEQLEDDLADLVAFVRRRHPDTRIVVGGHSSGGGLALRFAGGPHRELASGLVMLAPFLAHDAPTTRPDAGGWARPRLGVIIGLSILNGFGIRALNGTTAITFQMPEAVRDGTETLAYSFRLNTGYAPRDYASDLAAANAPVLALIGSNDEAFLAEQLEPTVTAHAQGDPVIQILPDVGHLDLPSAPATAAILSRWLRGF